MLEEEVSIPDSRLRNCASGSRPVSVHAYSIYGYFLYDRPYFSSTMGTHPDRMGETIRDINLQKEETESLP